MNEKKEMWSQEDSVRRQVTLCCLMPSTCAALPEHRQHPAAYGLHIFHAATCGADIYLAESCNVLRLC